MRRWARVLLVLCLVAGCAWGLQGDERFDGEVRRVNNERSHVDARVLKAFVELPPPADAPEEVLAEWKDGALYLIGRILDRCVDEGQRAIARLQVDGGAPEDPVDPDSPAADDNYNRLAGRGHDAETGRRKRKEWPRKVAAAAGGFVWNLIPWWIKYPLIAWGLAWAYLWWRERIKRMREASARDAEAAAHRRKIQDLERREAELKAACIEYDNAIQREHVTKTDRQRVGTGEHLKREHEWIDKDRKDDMKKWAYDALHLPEDRITSDRMNALGAEARARGDTTEGMDEGAKT